MLGWRFAIILSLLCVPLGSSAQLSSTAPDQLASAQTGTSYDARTAFEARLTTDPTDAQAGNGEVEASEALALRERSAGHRVEALGELLRARDYVPHNPRLLLDLGILEEEMRLYPDAAKDLATAQQIDPDNVDVDYAMARVRIDQGQLDAARKNMQAYLKGRPDDASAHYGLGRIYELEMQFDPARSEFLRSIELQPVQTEAYYELGDVALKQDAYAQALTYFQKVLARNGQHAGALADAGQVLYRQKQYNEALVYLRRAVAVAPGYQPGHYYLGLTLSRLGQKDEAQRELLTAQKLADQENKNAALRYQITPAPPVP
jgi:tetratricopeptide (TPR) repeat protein